MPRAVPAQDAASYSAGLNANTEGEMTELLSTQEAAKALGLSPQTLAILRVEGGGPRYVKLGRSVRYDPTDLAAWVEANKRASTAGVEASGGRIA